jgi:nicotinate-nucleotide pyrophosphorylase (carboxylating)
MTDLAQIVRRALDEDIGTGDVTSRACVPVDRRATGLFIARQHLVLAGTEVLPLMYDQLHLRKHDGDEVRDGETIAEVHAPARRLLEYERTALNFLQRLSGVATLARAFVDQVKGTNCKVLDTRKTTPGLRLLEKQAAAAGGVTNHRKGLYDAILIKNNHIAAAGGISQALKNARAAGQLPIEIEVRTRAELREALDFGATSLLLDNLTPAEAADWIREIAGRATVEISGGVTLHNVRAYAETGANFVSSGAITHSAPAVDLSFRLELL